MWERIKQFLSTDTQQKHNQQLQRLLAASLKESQALNERLVTALDRVLVSKFDPPMMPRPMEQPTNNSFPDLTDILSVDDDAEFLERTNA